MEYAGPSGGTDETVVVALMGNEAIYVAGSTTVALYNDTDYLIIRYGEDGEQEWVTTFSGPGGEQDYAVAIAWDEVTGCLFVTGRASTVSEGSDFCTLQYSSAGVLQWLGWLGGEYNDWPVDLTVGSGGNVCVTGTFFNYDYHHFQTVKYSSSGAQLWSWGYSGPSFCSDSYPRDLSLDGQGNVYVTGGSEGFGGDTDYATLKYSPAGGLIWEARYDGPAHADDEAVAMAWDEQEYLLVTGSSGEYGQEDCITLKYNTYGALLWESVFNGPGNGSDVPARVLVDGDGNVYVTGRTEIDDQNHDWFTLKYDWLGNQLWAVLYDYCGGDDYPADMVLDDSGNVIITGASESQTGPGEYYDWTTVSYSVNGWLNWVVRHVDLNCPDDQAQALALDDFGNIYVTGRCSGNAVTAKYRTQSPVAVALSAPWPIILPPAGGSFNFDLTLVNSPDSAVSVDLWTMARLPSGAWYGPVMGPVTLDLPASASLTKTRTQMVPATAPPGNYFYDGRIGTYPDTIWARDYFSFTKQYGRGSEGGGISGWSNVGESLAVASSGSYPAAVPPETDAIPALEVSPNPCNLQTILRLSTPADNYLTLRIYDTAGREVATLLEGWREAGSYEALFKASGLAGGVYFARLTAGEASQVQKLVVLK